ncbi:MAG: hypothetical protein HS116_01625 [Planctomycetes bacterium]|nr:hypothetical protein [Planctomycetota bacterium]
MLRPSAVARWYGAAALLLALGLAPAAHADIVVLKNGKQLEGRVVEKDDSVVVHLGYGSIVVKRDQIERIVKKETPLDTYHERASELAKAHCGEAPDRPAAARAWFELAGWCGQQNLPRQREEALARVLSFDSGHEAARQALGYLKVGDRWVTGDERHEALGLVKHQGQWVTPEARDEAVRKAESARQDDLDRKLQEADLRLKQAQTEKAETERALLESQSRQQDFERRRLDEEWAALERERWRHAYGRYGYPPYYYNAPIIVVPGKPKPPATPPAPETPEKPAKPPFPPVGKRTAEEATQAPKTIEMKFDNPY